MNQDTDTVLDPIAAPGTAETAWQEWDGLRSLPALSLADIDSAVVLAAHPDDQVLGFGGGLALLAARGVRLRIVVATDGEASHPHSRTRTAARLAEVRRAEDASALAALGAAHAEVLRLGLPDSGLDDRGGLLAARVAEAVRGFELCVAPWSGDMHPDHESVGRAARRACAAGGLVLWQYPVWMWHWAAPADERVPWERAALLELPDWAWVRKQEAVACHRSQILPLGPAPEDAPILPAAELSHFRRRRELVLR
ncbi:MAG TPA: PIG-L family deacetylase [Actinospica sp.]|nr:PIG-L family deacetylase [Actinospica sp.]